jgi:hypothetical protein
LHYPLHGTPIRRRPGFTDQRIGAQFKHPFVGGSKMSNSKRNTVALGTASVLAMFAMSGTAVADQHADKAYDADAKKMESTMDKHKEIAGKQAQEARQIASTFGVSELNDIEDWKITNSGEELGEIDRIGVDRSTGELLAVVGLKGVVGVNMKEVAVPLKSLRKSGDETLSTNLTKEQLQSKRDIDPWDGTYTQAVNK